MVKRKSGFEWLRILAMAMIITLHYMFKGEMIQSLSGGVTLTAVILRIMTALCIAAVDVYVLISGYFMVEMEFRPSRLVELILQVLEYSLLITMVMVVCGQVSIGSLSKYDWLGFILPVGTEEYWFITAYVLLYLLAPVLAAGVKNLDKKTHGIIVIVLLFLTMAEKSVLPVLLSTDHYGYDILWFIVLFMIAAYIRLYGIEWLDGHAYRSWALYFGSVFVIVVWNLVMGILGVKLGYESFTFYSGLAWDYNFLPVLTAAIGLFYAFRNTQFHEDSKASNVARWGGKLTLGVYLLHEHPLIRYRWQEWLGVKNTAPLLFIILNWLMCLVVIYAVGLLVEYTRAALTSKIKDMFSHKQVE